MKKYLLPENGQFYKANLHCHSNYSDGHLSPEELKKQYQAHGYSIIAYTDHDIMIPHDELKDDTFLPLHGYEMEINEAHDREFSTIKSCHICLIALEPDNLKQVCWHREETPVHQNETYNPKGTYLFGNAPKYKDQVQYYEDQPDFVRFHTPECINELIKTGRERGFFVTYNHPVWSMENYEDYTAYNNMHAMEICNFACVNGGYPDYNPQVYDDMLRCGKRIFCIAADDNHNHQPEDSPYYDSFGGFTMIKAENLDYRTITKALEHGHFYASQGPEIKELWYEDGELHLTCSPAERVDFTFGTRAAVPVIAEKGSLITHAHCKVPANSIYVRATVKDEKGKPANTNAYFVDELNA